jgi:ABC-type branched-subunit amino acid transport system ATPase component
VSFEVPAGKVFGLIGPNGAGKTTVFNLITGLLAPSGGAIELQGQSVLGAAPHQITRRGIARTFQNIRIFKDLTLLDNVVVGMHSHLSYGEPGWLFSLPGVRAQEQRACENARELLGWVGLASKASDIADNLSYGDHRLRSRRGGARHQLRGPHRRDPHPRGCQRRGQIDDAAGAVGADQTPKGRRSSSSSRTCARH